MNRPKAVRTTFLMEQHIGHRSYSENLRRAIATESGIVPNWIPITYKDSNHLLNRVPVTRNLRGSLIGLGQVVNGLHSADYDVAVFNTQVPAALAPPALDHRPYIICTDLTPIQFDIMANAYGHAIDKITYLREIKHRVNLRLFQRAARLLPWSTWTAQSLIDHYDVDPQKIEVLPPGINLNLFCPDHIRANEKPRILFVGGEFERKGGRVLLRAFERLADVAELHIVTRSTLQARPGLFVYSDMEPNSAELAALYRSCDIFALPTLAEAFGIVGIEACASGLPVVATHVGGLTDVVTDGENGFLIDRNNVEQLADRLQFLIEHPTERRQMGLAARRRAKERFDASRVGKRLAEIIIEVQDEIGRE